MVLYDRTFESEGGYTLDTAIHDITSQQTTMPFPLALTTFLTETVAMLKGSERRMCMARTVRMLGRGGQRKVAQELGWDRKTIRKGEYE